MTRAWTVLALVAVLSGCGSDFAPPPRTPEVVAEQARVVALLERQAGAAGRTTCAVRILGREGASTYAWSTCTSVDASGATSGTSGPLRLDGSRIRQPADGGRYADSIRAMFPERLAKAVLQDPERLRPRTP